MNRILTLTAALLLSGSLFGQITKVGGGLFYNAGYYYNNEAFDDHKLGNPAIFLTGIYELNLPFHIAPRISVHMPNIQTLEDADGMSIRTAVNAFSLDLDAHYVFNYLDRLEIYGLAGLNMLFARRSTEYDTPNFNESFRDSNTSAGFNLGVGSYMKVAEQLDLYGEVKFIVASQVQFAATLGLLLNVQWLARNEDPGF
ncbi:MAG: outer membrane beta-barrel protein [Bacteroidales bacterium]|nr:outer membrane beta-barrel protein [Bacteroidales bacterium]